MYGNTSYVRPALVSLLHDVTDKVTSRVPYTVLRSRRIAQLTISYGNELTFNIVRGYDVSYAPYTMCFHKVWLVALRFKGIRNLDTNVASSSRDESMDGVRG